MRPRLSALAAGILFLAGTGAAAAQAVVITPEQETMVREYIVAQRLEPVTLPAEIVVAEGTVLPETVELRVLEVPGVETQYAYLVVDRRIVVVEPATRRIVRIVEHGNGNGDTGDDTEDGVEDGDENGDGADDGNDADNGDDDG